MLVSKSTILVTITLVSITTPVLAQNFHGFGAPSYVTQQDNVPAERKAVELKAKRTR